MGPETITARIGEAVALDYSSDRGGARALYANMQDDPRKELLRDQHALEAADSLTSEGARDYYPEC
jgi:hypothetical protein